MALGELRCRYFCRIGGLRVCGGDSVRYLHTEDITIDTTVLSSKSFVICFKFYLNILYYCKNSSNYPLLGKRLTYMALRH